MVHFAGLDVSVKATSVCVVDDAGKVILEQRAPTEPADIIAVLTSLAVPFGRIGIEAGPLSQWLVNALTAVELPVICVETRHMKALRWRGVQMWRRPVAHDAAPGLRVRAHR
jgi:transposase